MKDAHQLRQCMQSVIATLALGLSGCYAHDVPAEWKAECVGRMQLRFQGDVEVAANSVKVLEAEYKIGSDQPSFDFVDGQHAGFSTLQTQSRILVTHPLTVTEQDQLAVAARQDAERVKRWVQTKHKSYTGQVKDFEFIDIKPNRGVASRVGGAYDVSLFVGQSMLRAWSGGSESWAERSEKFDLFLAGVASRKLGEVPPQAGICIPYAFIRDDGTTRRYIATTYRLREHPDVTVMLKDVSAVEVDPKANPKVYDPEAISDSFWARYDNTYRKSLRAVWSDPYKRTTMADSKGVESFVKIVREDGAVDYGYLVVARGDPAAKQDTPDLMLYVIQNSKNAKAKGVEHIGKDAFLALAQTIAKSVKRRVVTAP